MKDTPPIKDPDSVILTMLLEAGDAHVSGSRIAERLGMTRVSVWGRLEKLKEDGFVFEAVRNRGYRLVERPQGLHPALLRAHLDDSLALPELVYLPVVDSTNSEAERQLAQGLPAPRVILAGRQEQGRGRLGRSWESSDPENLYVSFAFRPMLKCVRFKSFTPWMGVRLCELLRERTGAEVAVKWPNDLYVGGRKLGGMLTEARVDSEQTRDLVFGLGLNVNSRPQAWPGELSETATSLMSVAGGRLDVNALAVAVIQCVLEGYREVADGRATNLLEERYARVDMLEGAAVAVASLCSDNGGEPLEGIARGLDEEGALRVELPTGEVHAVRAGEVTLRRGV